jgi:hypothetical protein
LCRGAACSDWISLNAPHEHEAPHQHEARLPLLDTEETMRFETMFRFLLATEAEGLGITENQHLEAIIQSIAAHGLTVKRASDAFGDVPGFLRDIRERGLEMPVCLLAHRHKFAEIDVESLQMVSGYIFASEDTLEFIAKNLADHLVDYAQSLKPPFFGAMLDYAELGYVLVHAFGAVMDNPDLIVTAVVGDGEAETSPRPPVARPHVALCG